MQWSFSSFKMGFTFFIFCSMRIHFLSFVSRWPKNQLRSLTLSLDARCAFFLCIFKYEWRGYTEKKIGYFQRFCSLLSQKLLFYLLQFKADFGCCTTTKSTLSRTRNLSEGFLLRLAESVAVLFFFLFVI